MLVAFGSVLAVCLLAGALPWLTGSDPARTVLRARQAERDADPAALDVVRAELDLPSSPLAGAWEWLVGAFQGDLGVSWVSGAPVAESVGSALAVSLNLATTAALAALGLAVLLVLPLVLGVMRGREGQETGGLRATAAVLAALPEPVLAVVLVAVFAIRLGLFPATGWTQPRDMVLPVTTIAVTCAGALTRILAAAISAVAVEDWVATWRANGARPGRIGASVARRAVAVAVPQVMLLVAGIVGAAVVVEDVFAIPGLGRLTLNAALAQDIPLVQGAVAALVALGVLLGTLGAALHRLLLGPALGAGQGAQLVRRERAVRARPSWAWWASAGALGVLVVGGLSRSGVVDPASRHQPPSWAHPLGTDHVGRDVWARVGHGAMLTIGMALAVSVICLAVGLLVGLTSRSGRAGVTDVLNAVPGVFLGIVIAAVAGPGLLSAAVAICLVGWIPLAVHARTLSAQTRAAGFFQAAIVSGASRVRLLAHHLLPSVFGPVSAHAVVRIPHLALAFTGLSFLGLGAGHDSPEWGKLLADSVLHLERAPWAVAAPAAGLVLLGLVATLARRD